MRGRARKRVKPRVVDITIRIRRKDGRKATLEQARAALWAAHKIAQKGGDVEAGLREWKIEAVNWRNTYASGKFKDFTYKEDISEVLANMGGILEVVGLAKLRVELVNRGEQ